jgi:ribosomal protein S18 acetylase RimI-like enzyme
MGDETMIRTARLDDAADLARVHVRSWQTAYRGLVHQAYLDSMSVESRIDGWNRILNRGTRVLLAEEDVEVVGFCSLGPADHDGWGEIYSIYVAPEHWGVGLGRELLVAGEAALTESGLERALLWVLDGNTRARKFYERQGWLLGKPIRIENIGGSDLTEVRYEKSLAQL